MLNLKNLSEKPKQFHKRNLAVLKSSFAKPKLSVLNYNNYKFSNNTLPRDQALNRLSDSNLQISGKDLEPAKNPARQF